MFSTKSAQSLRRLFAGYHEPLPLSKQQLQKLLDGLKASFRTQLDLEYGRNPENALVTSKTTGNDLQIRHSAATQHLKSILSNPLFSYKMESPTQGLMVSPSVPRRDPMDVFDHAVARGMMTLKAATGCLVAKRQLLSGSVADLASSETALRMVRWLRSSGADGDLAFLDNQAFVRALTPFLVAEGLENAAWDWITRTINDTSAHWENELRVKRASFVLAELVRTKSQPQYGNLDAAIQTILDAERHFEKSALLPDLLVLPWRSVSWLSTVESYSRTAPSEELFNAHIATADLLRRPFTVEKAHLQLHHPTHPDHTAAMDFFQDRKELRKLVRRLSPEKVNPAKLKGMSIIPWIAFLGHDTVNYLTQSGRSEAAEDVSELLRSELSDVFSETLGPT
ncbi:hypothetical protein JDV02_007162 [Purpureocillium takamizusanense]|uniref:Uncharacterized protein n=1 Tax=Purpureocillium takamizusanense TaxID=2060973 RepID=A0A9Q8QL43_9HYPO|nr:uncharacterized protein JDV02_007162 [Purpureocillium takamizusanense]UNI21146.1 hypothetical protein JDV02_007162 [Purpureocillium takamizusanense]